MRRVVFDVETTGLPSRLPDGTRDYSRARLLQVAHVVCDAAWNVLSRASFVVRPDGFPVAGTEIHGITAERAQSEGVPFEQAIVPILDAFRPSEGLVQAYAHNSSFDVGILRSELERRGRALDVAALDALEVRCTMIGTQRLVNARDVRGRVKWPKLSELYLAATGEVMCDAHDALRDVENLAEAMRRLVADGKVSPEF